MNRYTASLLCALTLAACTDGSGGGGGSLGDNDSIESIPEGLRKNISAVSYNAASERLLLRMNGVDGGPQDLVYVRTPTLDVNGYQAYTFQDDPLDRHFTALVAESRDGSVVAGAVADGGQFNRYFGGGFYQRSGTFDAPSTNRGQVSYAGSYAGVTNLDAAGDQLLPVPAGTDPAILPAQSARVEGEIYLNVNFGDNIVNGSVHNRRMVEDSSLALPDIVLISTGIDAEEGTFLGNVEFRGGSPAIGNYGGIFGGTDAAAVGGTLVLNDIDKGLHGWSGEEEIGVFVLTQCGRSGDDPLCDNL